MKLFYIFLATGAFVSFSYFGNFTAIKNKLFSSGPAPDKVSAAILRKATANHSVTGVTATVDDVVARAAAFKLLLTTAQINTLQQTFTTTLAKKWSNLPCGSMCRNGIQFSTLSATQLTAAKAVIAAAAGTAANDGYDELMQIIVADSLLNVVSNSNSYGKGIYFISFLNEPSTTTAWMLQYGGHHYAANIAFNGGTIVGVTPLFEGVEPKYVPTSNGTTYAPLIDEQAGMKAMLSSLGTTQLSTAKLSTMFSDVLLGPGQDGNFPSTKVGLAVSTLTTAQQALVLTAMKPWVNDVDATSAATLLSVYQTELSSTYIAYSGNATLANNADYVRIDGPSVWIEFVCQSGVVYRDSIHYHSVWRDHKRDYGNYLANTPLPLNLVSFSAQVQKDKRVISWITANEENVSYFQIERSSDMTMSGFTAIGRVQANNSTNDSYSFTDNEMLASSVYYYRLKIVDKDGNIRYSKVFTVNNNSIKQLTISPNPADQLITLSLPETVSNASIFINNITGKTVLQSLNRSGNRFSLDISNLANGVYFIQLQNNGVVTTSRFLKQSNSK